MSWDARHAIVRNSESQCVSVAILAGGSSRRMGRNKALVDIDGYSMLDRILTEARSISGDVAIIGERCEYHGRGVRVIADHYPGAAALGGIATALETSAHDHVLVVACDMPFLSRAVLRDMVRSRRGYDALVPMTSISEAGEGARITYHALHAIYSRSCLPEIRRAIDTGDLRIAEVLALIDVEVLTEDWLRERDPALATLVNVNTEDELREAMARYGTR